MKSTCTFCEKHALFVKSTWKATKTADSTQLSHLDLVFQRVQWEGQLGIYLNFGSVWWCTYVFCDACGAHVCMWCMYMYMVQKICTCNWWCMWCMYVYMVHLCTHTSVLWCMNVCMVHICTYNCVYINYNAWMCVCILVLMCMWYICLFGASMCMWCMYHMSFFIMCMNVYPYNYDACMFTCMCTHVSVCACGVYMLVFWYP